MVKLLIDAFFVWSVSSLITTQEGPFDIFLRWRRFLRGRGFFFGLFTCIRCFSVWVGWGVALYREGLHFEAFVYGLALSGAAITINKLVGD